MKPGRLVLGYFSTGVKLLHVTEVILVHGILVQTFDHILLRKISLSGFCQLDAVAVAHSLLPLITIISSSRSRRGPSRHCTTMSTGDSTPPEVSNRTGGIVSWFFPIKMPLSPHETVSLYIAQFHPSAMTVTAVQASTLQ